MRKVLLAIPIAALAMFVWAQSAEDLGDDLDRLALETFDRIQARSIEDGVEHCGYLGFDASGALAATPAMPGDRDSCEPALPPDGFEILASYHTHGAYSEDADAEVPSVDDLIGDFEEQVDGYIATPGGRVWLTVFEDRRSYQICGVGCVDSDTHYRDCPALPVGDVYTIETLREREARDTGAC